MSYIQIYPISRAIYRQKNIRHLSWMKRFLERTLQISNPPARLANVINVFQSAVGVEDQAYLVITKSDLTAPIEEADKSRDNTFSGMNSMLDFQKRLGTPVQQQAAERVLERVAYHKVSITDRYEDESEKIAQLVQDLEEGSLATDVATLGLTATVTLLKQQNQQVVSLMKQRQTDRSTVETNAMVKARALTDAAYEDLEMVLNAFAITEYDGQSSPYDGIIRIINSDINYYLQYVFTNAAATSGGSSSEEGGSSSEQGGSDSGNGGSDSDNGGGDNNGGGGTTPTPDPDAGFGGGDNQGGGDNNGGGGTTPTPDPDAGFGGN